MNGYQKDIVKITGCDVAQVYEVENTMRNMVGEAHSGCLDHLTKKEFKDLAKRAFSINKKVNERLKNGQF